MNTLAMNVDTDTQFVVDYLEDLGSLLPKLDADKISEAVSWPHKAGLKSSNSQANYSCDYPVTISMTSTTC